MGRIYGFTKFNNIVASLKLTTNRSKCVILCVYAPHNMKRLDERQQFYLDVGKIYESTTVNGPKYILGDFNARIGDRHHGEEGVLGQHTWERGRIEWRCAKLGLTLDFCFGREF